MDLLTGCDRWMCSIACNELTKIYKQSIPVVLKPPANSSKSKNDFPIAEHRQHQIMRQIEIKKFRKIY